MCIKSICESMKGCTNQYTVKNGAKPFCRKCKRKIHMSRSYATNFWIAGMEKEHMQCIDEIVKITGETPNYKTF